MLYIVFHRSGHVKFAYGSSQFSAASKFCAFVCNKLYEPIIETIMIRIKRLQNEEYCFKFSEWQNFKDEFNLDNRDVFPLGRDGKRTWNRDTIR